MVGCGRVVRGNEIRIFKLTTDPAFPPSKLTWEEIEKFSQDSLFAGKSWKWSNQAWALPKNVGEFIKELGDAGLSFFQALERLYLKSAADEKILRNEELRVPWVAQYLDAGKPDWLVHHSRSTNVRGVLPPVLRPDLLPSRDGFALAEWDSVPGGIGLTDHLGRIYLKDRSPKMAGAFGDALVSQAGKLGRSARFAILVSEESATYRPEMDCLGEELRKQGLQVEVARPDEVSLVGDEALLNGQKIDVIYRFWELFDPDVPQMKDFAKSVEAGNLVVTPAMRPFLEEKLSLGLLHHPKLQSYWAENLSKSARKLLLKTVPTTWIMDPSPVPPGAYLDGPSIGGQSISDWNALGKASKKERSLVLKASGFHESSWGARSVVVGEDVSTEDWTTSVKQALDNYPSPIFIIQEFKKPSIMEHPVFDDGNLSNMKGRLRLSPYYFVENGKVNWQGALATFCPADKKIIHGMRDGALMPCEMPA